MSIGAFFDLCVQHPWAFVAILLNMGVIFVNGWTDAPNAIAVCVSTRCMKPRNAVITCAIGNLIGVLVSGAFASAISKVTGADVSKTIANLVNLHAYSIDRTMMAIASGLLAIVIVSLVCTAFGFPSSQTNCLIGGLTGAGVAITALSGAPNWFQDVSAASWIRVAFGFFGSMILGFLLGFLLTKLISICFAKVTRGSARRFFEVGEKVSAGFLSLAHGFQDGAMFIGVFYLIAALLSNGEYSVADLAGTWWLYVPVAILIALGTMMGGYNIIKTMGRGIAKLSKHQAFATDLASALGIVLATCFGLPVSTGTVKSTAIMGCAAARSVRRVKWNTAGKLVFWGIVVFPASMLAGFLAALLFSFTC